MREDKFLQPVMLDPDKCKGCINCMKRCPTEAIRVRNGKAKIIYSQCIGCGECIRICTHRAKRAVFDKLSDINDYKYKIALPPPSFYGQFENMSNIDYVLNGLKKLGFDDVYEVSRSAEIISDVTRELLKSDKIKRPVISSACPAIVELILMRFHSLADNLLPALAPVEVSAKLAREKAVKETGLKPYEIGVFFISPCPAKVYELIYSDSSHSNEIDGVLSAGDVYFKLLDIMKKLDTLEPIANSGIVGIGWAISGGECAGILSEKYLAADGIENCMGILKELEDAKLTDLDFIELNACPGGCVGGVLNVENPFIAKTKLQSMRKYRPVTLNKFSDTEKPIEWFTWTTHPKLKDAFKIDDNIEKAMEKVRKLEELAKQLPSLDCGVCGAPSCRAFAEDVVNGLADISECKRKSEL